MLDQPVDVLMIIQQKIVELLNLERTFDAGIHGVKIKTPVTGENLEEQINEAKKKGLPVYDE